MITIYWGVNTSYFPEGISVEAPIAILQKLIRERIPKNSPSPMSYDKCPSIIDELTNLYGLKPFCDYTLKFGKEVTSSEYDQKFFEKVIRVRSIKGNLFELMLNFVFFTEDPSLEMSLLPAYLEDNSVSNSTIIIPGKIDIGKYFRSLSVAFHMKKKCNKLLLRRKEIFHYVKFHTKEKIRFKQFLWTPEIDQMNFLMMSAKNRKYDFVKLDYYYNIFKRFNFKKKILKNIKENLCLEIERKDFHPKAIDGYGE